MSNLDKFQTEKSEPIPAASDLFLQGDEVVVYMDSLGMSDEAKDGDKAGIHPENRTSWALTSHPFRLENGDLVRIKEAIVNQHGEMPAGGITEKVGELSVQRLDNQAGDYVEVVRISKEWGQDASITDLREDTSEPVIAFTQRVLETASSQLPPKPEQPAA